MRAEELVRRAGEEVGAEVAATSTGACGVRCTPSTYSSAPAACTASAIAGEVGSGAEQVGGAGDRDQPGRARRARPASNGSSPVSGSKSTQRTVAPTALGGASPTAGCSRRGRAGSPRPRRRAPRSWPARGPGRRSAGSSTGRTPPRRVAAEQVGHRRPGPRRPRPRRAARRRSPCRGWRVPRSSSTATASATWRGTCEPPGPVEVGGPVGEGGEAGAHALDVVVHAAISTGPLIELVEITRRAAATPRRRAR